MNINGMNIWNMIYIPLLVSSRSWLLFSVSAVAVRYHIIILTDLADYKALLLTAPGSVMPPRLLTALMEMLATNTPPLLLYKSCLYSREYLLICYARLGICLVRVLSEGMWAHTQGIDEHGIKQRPDGAWREYLPGNTANNTQQDVRPSLQAGSFLILQQNSEMLLIRQVISENHSCLNNKPIISSTCYGPLLLRKWAFIGDIYLFAISETFVLLLCGVKSISFSLWKYYKDLSIFFSDIIFFQVKYFFFPPGYIIEQHWHEHHCPK